jgi:hypothetical protein
MTGHGRLLALVPLVSGGTDDVGREAVDPVLDVALVLGELQGERHPGLIRLRDGKWGGGFHGHSLENAHVHVWNEL